ncbi:MAG: PEP/pyruvate-binding domain-containing protein [Acidimicrobiia bacterium]
MILLTDERALDPEVVGHKAARLAAARRAGLPVPDGFVVPAEVSRPAMALGSRLLEEGGSGKARLAIARMELDPGLVETLEGAGRGLGGRLAVRSSTRVEVTSHWAGAFSSYLGIGPEEMAVALRGCWASAFTVDALGRAARVGLSPGTIPIAALVQAELEPAAGGKTELHGDGGVVVTGTSGSPAALMSGWERGWRVRVGSNAVDGDAALMKSVSLGELAELARALHQATGDDLLEWIWSGEGPFIVQCGRRPRPAEPPPRSIPDGLTLEMARRVARLAVRFPGPLGEELVLPWALGLEVIPEAESIRSLTGAAAALAEAENLVGHLAAGTWGLPPVRARRAARSTIGSLHGPRPGAALRRLEGLRPADLPSMRRLLAHLNGVADFLVGRDVLPSRQSLWSLSLAEVRRVLTDEAPTPLRTSRSGPGPWEPFLFGVASAFGDHLEGIPASSGMGAGPLRRVDDPEARPGPGPRSVLAIDVPLPRVAPLLWDAAGLVCAGGGPAAHLFDVARSLVVPALAGCDHSGIPDGALVAVDGAAGSAHWVRL